MIDASRPKWALILMVISFLIFGGSFFYHYHYQYLTVQLLSLGLGLTSIIWWALASLVLSKIPAHRRQLFPVRILLLLPLLGLTAFQFGGLLGFGGYWVIILGGAAWLRSYSS